jgi:flagellar protein FlgJ
MTTISNNLAGAALSTVTSGIDATKAKISGAAKEFEAIFVRQMLAAARKANPGEDLFGSSAIDTFRDMQDSQLADMMTKTGALGLAKQIEAHMARLVDPAGAAAPVTTTGATTTDKKA